MRPGTRSRSRPPPPRSAAAGSARPHQFSFTTPTVKLLEHQLVPPRRTRRCADGDPAPLQPAGSRRPSCCRTSRAGFAAARLGGAGADCPKGSRGSKTTDPSSVQRFNAKVAATRAVANVDRAGGGPADRPTGTRSDSPPSRRSRRPRNDDARCAPESWVRVSRFCRRRRRRRGRRSRRRSRNTSSKSSAPSSSTASTARRPVRPTSATAVTFRAPVERDRLRGRGPGRRRHRRRASSCPSRSRSPRRAAREVELGRGRVLLARGRRVRSRSRRRGRSASPSIRSLRSADGQTLGYTWAGVGRELARAGVHQLRRRPRRVGAQRRTAAAVLRAELPRGHAVVAAGARFPI